MCHAKPRINYKKLATDEKKAKYIDKIAKQVDRKYKKLLLNILANKIKTKIKNKMVKN